MLLILLLTVKKRQPTRIIVQYKNSYYFEKKTFIQKITILFKYMVLFENPFLFLLQTCKKVTILWSEVLEQKRGTTARWSKLRLLPHALIAQTRRAALN